MKSLLRGQWNGGANDKTIISGIMLRFRPIAPKPASGGSGSGDPPPEKMRGSISTKGRAKRKYVRDKKNSKCKRREDQIDRTVMTLQLLPDVTGRSEGSAGHSDLLVNLPAQGQQLPVWLNFNGIRENHYNVGFFAQDQLDPTGLESSVTVECITDVYKDGGGGLGSTDKERINNLEDDTCPGFVSDGENTVKWINPAYRKMTWLKERGGGGSVPQTAVKLVMRAELPVACTAFACRVRVQYSTWRKEKQFQILPCDAWRMDFGGFAWRLDTNAALSLGR